MIPYYNPMLATHMLQQHGSLSLLCIHATDFRKIALEYGAQAYNKLLDCFQQILIELWGATNSFRKGDILCRNLMQSNIYFILLQHSRSNFRIPPPGALEKLSDRIVLKLQNRLWSELFKPEDERILPSYLKSIPKFSIGHATGLFNPCMENEDVVNNIIDSSKEVAKVQSFRIKDRQRELIQALIQTDDILQPHYQAVCELKKINVEKLKESVRKRSLKPLSDSIHSFESLIRVKIPLVETLIKSNGSINIDPRYLTPQVLFSMASYVKLDLELDQTCLAQATQYFRNLPGILLVNILPRNFYYIEKLKHLIPEHMQVTFEVSESEAINNFDLLTNARKRLAKQSYGIAIDDFGKGYAGLDRILKIQPDIIKLDRCLIQNIHEEKSKKAFVAGVVNAARITKSLVLAEGVEEMEELITLKSLDIDLVQGFLLHRPQDINCIHKDLGIKDTEKQKFGTVA